MLKKIKPEKLNFYLERIESLFPEFRSEASFGIDEIETYYSQSYWGYAFFHSWAGAIHMAMSKTETFSKNDYFRQAEEVGELLASSHTTKELQVVEVGCGRGYNICYLAEEFKDIKFVGIDYSSRNINSAKTKLLGLSNARAEKGDFHSLDSLKDSSSRLVFAVETLCHATNLDQALSAIARILAEGGHFVVFDGFRNPSKMTSNEIVKAVYYTEKAMAVPSFKELKDFQAVAAKHGLFCEKVEDRSSEIMPNLIRLSDLAKAFFKITLISKLILSVVPRGLVANSIAGLLMAITVESGAHQYLKLTFRKKN
jgi:arsenite methyltransferase